MGKIKFKYDVKGNLIAFKDDKEIGKIQTMNPKNPDKKKTIKTENK